MMGEKAKKVANAASVVLITIGSIVCDVVLKASDAYCGYIPLAQGIVCAFALCVDILFWVWRGRGHLYCYKAVLLYSVIAGLAVYASNEQTKQENDNFSPLEQTSLRFEESSQPVDILQCLTSAKTATYIWDAVVVLAAVLCEIIAALCDECRKKDRGAKKSAKIARPSTRKNNYRKLGRFS